MSPFGSALSSVDRVMDTIHSMVLEAVADDMEIRAGLASNVTLEMVGKAVNSAYNECENVASEIRKRARVRS
jgi:hypothetical protein